MNLNMLTLQYSYLIAGAPFQYENQPSLLEKEKNWGGVCGVALKTTRRVLEGSTFLCNLESIWLASSTKPKVACYCW